MHVRKLGKLSGLGVTLSFEMQKLVYICLLAFLPGFCSAVRHDPISQGAAVRLSATEVESLVEILNVGRASVVPSAANMNQVVSNFHDFEDNIKFMDAVCICSLLVEV